MNSLQLGLFAVVSLLLSSFGEVQVWTDIHGRKIEATLEGFSGGMVYLTEPNGKERAVRIDHLAPESQKRAQLGNFSPVTGMDVKKIWLKNLESSRPRATDRDYHAKVEAAQKMIGKLKSGEMDNQTNLLAWDYNAAEFSKRGKEQEAKNYLNQAAALRQEMAERQEREAEAAWKARLIESLTLLRTQIQLLD